MNEVSEKERARRDSARELLGTVCCIVGILCGVGGVLFATLGASDNVSAGVIGVMTIFFMAAASTGMISGVTPLGHGYN